MKENLSLACYNYDKQSSLIHRIVECERYRANKESLMSPFFNGALDLYKILENPDFKEIKKLQKLLKEIFCENEAEIQ